MTPSEAREKAVLSAIKERQELVNAAIPDELPVLQPLRLYEASRYLLDAGGKRLRPALLLLVAEALSEVEPLGRNYRRFTTPDGNPIDIMKAAVSVEVIQSFTLIHDDIMDDDDLRRGVPAVHRKYDLETAILAGDTLYSKAFEIMLNTGCPPCRSIRALRVLATTCTKICEGQAMDIQYERRDDVSIEDYLAMIEHKTAYLFKASTSVPAVLLGANDRTIDGLSAYGLQIGKAFQIQDDVLDLTTPSKTLGKRRGSDLIEGKRTLVTLHARQQGVNVDNLLDSSNPETVTEADVEAAVAELDAAGSVEFAMNLARSLVEDGKSELSVLPENDATHLINDLAEYLIDRKY